MGGSSIDDDWDFTASGCAESTIVLVGKAGNGKSATGNSILGRKAFRSVPSAAGVTTTSELASTVMNDGRTVNVIDTPGLFDFSDGSDGREIVKCIDLAKDGIHAVLVVFSVRSRFTKEEAAGLESLKSFFGDKIVNYMIVVITGGDDLEEEDLSLSDYIGHRSPEPLKDFLRLCKNRVVLFDNKTKDKTKQAQQLHSLLSLVDSVVAENGGMPFSDELFAELKEGAAKKLNKEKYIDSLEGLPEHHISKMKADINKSYNDQLNRITEMVEQKLQQTIERLEKQLAEEHAARLEAQKVAEEAQKRSDDKIRELRESLEKAQKENEEFRKMAERRKCLIL